MLLTAELVPAVTSTGASARVAAHVAPRFRIGDAVLMRNWQPTTHTRLPGYIRGKKGVVEKDYGVFAFPTLMPTARARSRSTATVCASPRASCGASRRRTATRCAWTCSTTTWTRGDGEPRQSSTGKMPVAG